MRDSNDWNDNGARFVKGCLFAIGLVFMVIGILFVAAVMVKVYAP